MIQKYIKKIRSKNLYQKVYVDFKNQNLKVYVSLRPESEYLLRLDDKYCISLPNIKKPHMEQTVAGRRWESDKT